MSVTASAAHFGVGVEQATTLPNFGIDTEASSGFLLGPFGSCSSPATFPSFPPIWDGYESATSIDGAAACSLVGQPIAAVVNHVLAYEPCGFDLGNGAFGGFRYFSTGVDSVMPSAHAQFSIAWPPTFPSGGRSEKVELHAALSIDSSGMLTGAGATALPAQRGGTGVAAGRGDWMATPEFEVLTRAASVASEVCGRVLVVRDDVVFGEEDMQLEPGGGSASARLRLGTEQPGATQCVLAGSKRLPTLHSLHDAAPLIGLPQAARDEAHRLLWRMMHEAFPPNHSELPFDPDVFRLPLGRLPPKLQAALSWAWRHHFRVFAHDFSFLLDCLPGADPATATAAIPSTATTTASRQDASSPWPNSAYDHVAYDYDTAAAAEVYDTAAAAEVYDTATAATAATAARDADVSHYQSVLAQMVSFLRDNDMFACLATLLTTAVSRGLAVVAGEGFSLSAPASPQEQQQCGDQDFDPEEMMGSPLAHASSGGAEGVPAPGLNRDGMYGAAAADTLTSALAALQAAAAAHNAAATTTPSSLSPLAPASLLLSDANLPYSGYGVDAAVAVDQGAAGTGATSCPDTRSKTAASPSAASLVPVAAPDGRRTELNPARAFPDSAPPSMATIATGAGAAAGSPVDTEAPGRLGRALLALVCSLAVAAATAAIAIGDFGLCARPRQPWSGTFIPSATIALLLVACRVVAAAVAQPQRRIARQCRDVATATSMASAAVVDPESGDSRTCLGGLLMVAVQVAAGMWYAAAAAAAAVAAAPTAVIASAAAAATLLLAPVGAVW